MVSAFAAGFVGGLGKIADEKRKNKREDEKYNQELERLKEEKLDERAYQREMLKERFRLQREQELLPAVIKRIQETEELANKFANSTRALRARLTDNEGNLYPGAEALITNGQADHILMEKIIKAEEKAAENDQVLTLSGQDLIDSATVYSSEAGSQVPMPDISVEDLLEGNVSVETMAEIAYSGGGETPEPYVVLDPVVNQDPNKFDMGREIFKGRVLQKLDTELNNATDATQNSKLFELREAYLKDPDGPVYNQIIDMYGKDVYGEMLEEGNEYFYIEDDPVFAPIREAITIDSSGNSEDLSNDKAILLEVISDPNAPAEQRQEAQRLLDIITGN